MMRKLCLFLISSMLLIGFEAFPDAKHPKTGEQLVYEAVKVRGSVIVDGDLREWKLANKLEINCKEQIYKIFQGDWTGPDDCSAIVYVMWDEGHIYIAADIKDDKLICAQTGGTIWKNECIEVLFDPNNVDINPGNWPHTSHYQFGFAPLTPKGKGWKDVPQKWVWCHSDRAQANQEPNYVEVASKVSDPYTGYTIEAAIDVSGLDDLKPEEGRVMGFQVAIDDADENPERDLQITWSGKEAHDQQFGFGDIVFVGPAAVRPSGKLAAVWGELKR